MEKDFEFSNGVIEMLGLYSRAENLYIVVVYRQPNDPTGGNKSGPVEFQSALSRLKSNLSKLPEPTPNVVICGDFNLPYCDWSANKLLPGATREEKEMFTDLNNLCDEHFLKQYIHCPTHIAGNTLDLLFSNNQHLVHSYECLEVVRNVSDHMIVRSCTYPFSIPYSERT